MNKNAILFSLLALLISAFFIAFMSLDFQVAADERMPVVNTRILTLDSYVKSFDRYVADSLRVNTYLALENLYDNRERNPIFFSDYEEFNQSFHNCMVCSRIDCSDQAWSNANRCFKQNEIDFNESIYAITDLALKNLNIRTTYVINSIDISQETPFDVKVRLNMSYNVSDVLDSSQHYYASWSKNSIIEQYIPINGLHDPFIEINSNKAISRPIIETDICWANTSCWNINNAKQFYDSEAYRYSPKGISYIERFWNGTGGYCPNCRIETILPKTYTLTNMNSSIDSLYWTGDYTCGASNVTLWIINSTQWNNVKIVLDEESSVRYGIANVTQGGEKQKWAVCP
jgi:hypothetical protein